MFALIAAALLAAADVPRTSADEDARRAYDAARSVAGRSPDDQVRLALWCEAHGLDAERARHLAQAALADPAHAAARGLLGLVARGDRWLRPEAVADQAKSDAALAATLAEYDAKRSSTPYTAEGQWALAQWAEAKGLKDQARAHWTAVVRLDPRRDEAWKKLGYRRHDGRWVTDAGLAAERADAEAQKAADKKWKPLLEKWRAQLARPAARAEAEANLLAVTEPRAAQLVGRTFLGGGPALQVVGLRTLAQIDSAEASRLIALLAVSADDAEVRRAAIETLRGRDPRDFAAPLIAPLRARVEYEIQHVAGPGSTGRLLVKEPKQRVQRLYSTPATPPYLAWLARQAQAGVGMSYGYDDAIVVRNQATVLQEMNYAQFQHYRPADPQIAGVVAQAQHNAPNTVRQFLATHPHNRMAASADPSDYFNYVFSFQVQKVTDYSRTPIRTQTEFPLEAMLAEYRKTAAVAQQQLIRDAAMIDEHNRQVDRTNERLTVVLRAVSGVDHGDDRMAWTKWLVDLSGYAMIAQSESDVPTFTVDVPLAYQPQAVPIGQTTFVTGPTQLAMHYEVNPSSKIASCFGAGTLVQTLTGPRPIESLRVGDVALAQSVASGALRYQPILAVHHNPPSPTFLIRVQGDVIVSSPFHRFWKVGEGWVMARDVRAGDRLRLLSGTAVVEEYKAGEVQPVFNLDVAEDADFFAGSAAALVHDNTLPDTRLVPFDRQAGPAEKAESAVGP